MIQKWTKSICALALALLFTPLISAEAHDRSRRHRHRDGVITWLTGRTDNNGVRRRVRVRRGRNMTPGVRRGRVVVGRRFDRRDIIRSRRGRGHGRGHGRH